METDAAHDGRAGRPPGDPAPAAAPGRLLLAPPRKLSEELNDLCAHFAERPVTLREVIVVLRGRAYTLIVILLSLPFLVPLPLPGVSTALGLAIAIIALRLVLAQRPWLPKRLQLRELPAGFFGRLIALAGRVIRFLESLLRPRWLWLTSAGWQQQVHALVMLVAAVELMLPLPIPLTNTLPAWTILLVAGGLMERDGVCVCASYAMLAVSTGYLFFLGEAARRGVDALWVRFFG